MSAEKTALEAQEQTATDLAVVKITTQLAAFDKVAAGIGDLEHKYKGIVYDTSTSRGLQAAKDARAVIRKPRYELENMRKALKAPVLDLGRTIDARAKDINAKLLAIEEPIDEQVKKREAEIEAERQAKIKAEEERIAGIRARIQTIREMPAGVSMVKPEVVAASIESLKQLPVDETFQEFRQEAHDAKEAALGAMIQLHAAAVERETEAERVARERAELERLRQEAAERDRARVAEEKAAAERREQEIQAERAKLRAEREEQERAAKERQSKLDAQEAAQRAEQERITRERTQLEQLHREQRQRTEVSGSRNAVVPDQPHGVGDSAAIVASPSDGLESAHAAAQVAKTVAPSLTSSPSTDEIISTLMEIYEAPRDRVVDWLIGAVDELLDQVEA